MNVARPCVACHANNTCECRTSLARFFELLIEADKRVSSIEATSIQAATTTVSASACVDKLEGQLTRSISLEQIALAANVMGLKTRHTILRNKKPYIQIGDHGTYFRKSFDGQYATHLISKPSAFATFQQYNRHLVDLLSDDTLAELTITRLDFTVDYEIPFKRAITAIDVSGKQTDTEYEDKSSTLTGIRVGKGAEKIVFYDKQIEADLGSPRTRIEIQLSGKKLPARQFHQLLGCLKTFDPFNQVEVFDLVFKDELTLDSTRVSRLHKLKAFIDEFGFIRTRRRLNDQGNFQRDFGSLFTREAWPNQPSTVFRAAMKSFTT